MFPPPCMITKWNLNVSVVHFSSVEALLAELRDLQRDAGEHARQILSSRGNQTTPPNHLTFHCQILEPFTACEGSVPNSISAQVSKTLL